MKFITYKTVIDRTKWHKWFAWYPVRVKTERIKKGKIKSSFRWLEYVYRKVTNCTYCFDDYETYEYKEIPLDKN